LFRSVIKEQLRVPAKIDFLGDLRDFVTRVGKRHGIPDRIINAFKLSIDEAATNIIKHAYRDWDGDITIRTIIKKQSLTILLIDQGKYFDPRQVNDPDLQRYVEIGKKGGLGIFIMRRLLDNIDYRKSEEGNELWLTKHFDERKKTRFSVSAIPLSLKARYWLISLAVLSSILAAGYAFTFLQARHQVMDAYLDQGRNACSYLAGEISNNMSALSQTQLQEMLLEGSYDLEVLESAAKPINSLILSKHSDLMHSAFVVDNFSRVLASSNREFLQPLIDRFTLPSDHRYVAQDAVVYSFQDHGKVIDIVYPVKSVEANPLCTAHFLIEYAQIRAEIVANRMGMLKIVLLILAIGAAGLFVLIYVVMNPFRRLAEWVKQMGQPGVVDEMDIDSSTEVGEIAQAFSDITKKLRISQKNLAEQERLQKEMQVAQEIQQTLLPSEFPDIEGYQIVSYYEAAKEVGGDYFDFVEVDKDSLGIVVGDVSGKGVPGSLVMTMIRTALRTEARGVKDAAEVLARVNDFIVNDMKKGMFVTLFYVIIDSKRRRLNYASAGHNPMILFRASSNKTYYLNPRGFPIGISLPDNNLFRNSIESDTLSLNEDDILIIYTDGITEAMNGQRDLFGEERFLQSIRTMGKRPADEFVDSLHQEILSFTEGNPQNDDITLVCIKEKTTADKLERKRAKDVYQAVQAGGTIKEACEKAGISIYAYNKYKEIFEQKGIEVDESLLPEEEPIEARHLSIEEKTKIYDIIRRFPEYGAKRIAEELNTDYYGNVEISTSRIYEELVRSRLNTHELREAFIMRGGRKRKRIKPPGTPMLTIDGRVIIQKAGFHNPPGEEEEKYVIADTPRQTTAPAEARAAMPEPPKDEAVSREPKAPFDLLTVEPADLFAATLEDLLDKRKFYQRSTVPAKKEQVKEEPESLQKSEQKPEAAPQGLDSTLFFGEDELLTADAEQAADEDSGLSDDSAITESLASIGTAAETDAANLNLEQDIDIEPHANREVDIEELDFVQLIQMGEGLEEPKKNKDLDRVPIDKSAVEEAIVVTDEDRSSGENGLLQDVFDEFVDIEEGQDLTSAAEEFHEQISDNLLHEEIDRQLQKYDADRQAPPQRPAAQKSAVDSERKLDFDDLIELLDQKPTQFDSDVEKPVPEPVIATRERPVDQKGIRDSQFKYLRKLYEEERFDLAIDTARSFLKNFPDDHHAQMLLGNSYFRMQQYREAQRIYENVLRIDPQNTNAYENLGVVYANQGDFLRAVEKWEKLLQIAPNRSDIRRSIERAKKFLH